VESELSPTSRALLTLEILQSNPGITAEELGRRLGVSDRAARRYIALLREADIPVESDRGPYGGYRLGRGLRLPPLHFSATEALGLVMAVLDGQHPAADRNDPVGSALGKIIRALPENVGRQAAIVREHAASSGGRGSASPDPTITSELVAAVAASRRVHLTYRSDSGREWETDVDPWAVVVRHSRWYLLCHAHVADAVRTYRLDRVRSVETLEVTFPPPADLDPAAALEAHLGLGSEFPTRTRFDAPLSDVAPFIGPAMGRLEPLDDEHCVLVGSTSNPAMYAGEWLAALPFPLHVEGGPELIDAMRTLVARLGASVDPDRQTQTS